MRKLLNEKLVDLENGSDDEEEDEEEEESESEEEEEDETPEQAATPEKTPKQPKRGRPKGSLNLSTLVAKGLVPNAPGVMPLKKRLRILHEHLKDFKVSQSWQAQDFFV